jgi:hypothetical protein
VAAVNPCPTIEPGPGQIVTGVFVHESANVIDLHVEGLDDAIGVTANHPFWSEDRQAFVPAGELRPGERLRSHQHTVARVAAIVPRAGPETVYNLEVAGQHVYQVSAQGLLVHNTCGRLIPNPWGRLGGPLHRTRVAEAAQKLAKNGWTRIPRKPLGDQGFTMLNGRLRFPDLVMQRNGEMIAIQVGKRTLRTQRPIARELRALSDLRDSGVFKHVFFLGY